MTAAERNIPEDPAAARLRQALAAIFDAAWYVARYPDVASAGLDPMQHFILHGAEERRDPNRWFDGAWYVERYPDVAASGMNPLLHYLKAGAAELRNPHPRFDAAWYVGQNPDAAQNPLVYHLAHGIRLGLLTEKPFVLADYLPSTQGPWHDHRRIAVDVIIPAYRGLAQTRRCLDSVLADTDRPAGRVIVIDDCSPEPALSAWLRRRAKAGAITLIRNERNLGFVASVNAGMTAAGRHDVVLLNSDTEVPRGWLRRLVAQAHAGPRIASVSPFSNNATICSYPANAGGPIPLGLGTAAVDDVCRTVNAGRGVDVPTTVGFCMYVRRDALDDVGLFDEKAFGKGYGEENDFCMRAVQLGWRHVLACDIFVYHEGAVSFGADADEHTGRARSVLHRKYPDYPRIVARHVANDDAGPFRFAITAALFRQSGLPTVLVVCHDLGGGVRRHVDDLVQRLRGQANFLLMSGTARGPVLSVPGIPGHPVVPVPAERLDDVVKLLRSAAVARVHIHHAMAIGMDVRDLIQRLEVPFDLTVHDYYAICPQVNLLPWPEAAYCGEPGPAACNACIANRPSHGAKDILSWRRGFAWQFLDADRVFCPSEDVRARLARHGFAGRAIVAPHETIPRAPWRVRGDAPGDGPLRIAVLGVLANHKGAHVVASLVEQADRRRLRVHLIGYVEAGFPAAVAERMQITGKYSDDDLPGLIARAKPHVIWFPSSCPETYSFTLSAAIETGLPIAATGIGSFQERLTDRPLTWVVPPTTAAADWIAMFEEVRAALQAPKRKTAVPVRAAAPDVYTDGYLRRAGKAARARRRRIVVIPERLDNGAISPCAYIRLLQPLDHPAIGGDFDVILADADTAPREPADVIVTQRYAIADVTKADRLAAHAKRIGAGLVYDLDDDLLHIPRGHADAGVLRPKASVVRRMLRAADQVWVSTEALAASVGRDARVVPNGLDERIWVAAPRPDAVRHDPVRVLCMGTATHDDDFTLIAPALERLVNEFGGRIAIDMLGFSGARTLPAWINRLDMWPNARSSYPGFVNWIVQQDRWEIGLAPLLDTPFNRCKSAIKTLDYAALGLAVVASDTAVYRGSLADGAGGLLAANTADAWYAAISRLLRDQHLRRRLRAGARAEWEKRGTLAAQATLRRAALAEVIGDRTGGSPTHPHTAPSPSPPGLAAPHPPVPARPRRR